MLGPGQTHTALAGRLRLIRTALNEALALVSKQVFNGLGGTVIEPSRESRELNHTQRPTSAFTREQ
jgi:hypothetical protein